MINEIHSRIINKLMEIESVLQSFPKGKRRNDYLQTVADIRCDVQRDLEHHLPLDGQLARAKYVLKRVKKALREYTVCCCCYRQEKRYHV